MEKGLSNSRGKSKDADAVLEKQQRMPSEEIQSCEAENSSEIERKYPTCDHVSTSHCTKGDSANSLKSQSPAVSTSRHLEVELGIYQKEICAERTSGSMSCSNGYASSGLQDEHPCNGNPKGSEVSVQSVDGIDSAQHISVKSDVSSDTGSPLIRENNKSNVGRTKGNWINASEDRLKSFMHAPFHVTQPKTESSSSNSTHVILPVSSSSHSFQETSLEAKSCKRCGSGLKNCNCLGFKCTMEELAVGSVALDLGMAAQISQRAIDNVRARDDKKVSRRIADHNSTVVEKINIWKSSPSKQKNDEILSQHKEEHSCEQDNTLEVAWKVAREAEKRVGFFRETSGSFSSIKEENGEAVRLSSVDFAPYKKCSMEDRQGVKLCNEQSNCDSFCSNEEVMDPETPMKNKHLLAAEGSSQGMDPALHETNSGPHAQESSVLTTKQEVVDQTPRLSGFDLNEDIQESEVEYPKHLVNGIVSSYNVSNLSTPVPIVAKSGVPIFLPIAPLKLEGELGWRGSAATSAFRPAAHSNGSHRHRASSISENNCSSKHSQEFTGFDLNVAAAGDDCAMELLPREHVTTPSGYPFKESSVEVGSKRADMLDIDLNRPSENDGNCPQSSIPVSLSRQAIVDLDLNDNLSFVDSRNDAHWPGQCSQLLRNKGLNNPAVSFQGNSRQPDFNWVRPANSADFSSMQLFSHGHALPFLAAAQNVRPPMTQMQREVHLQPILPYTPQTIPPHAYPYNYGFCIGPTDPVSSTIHSSGVLPYMTDPRGTTVIPQMPGPGAFPTFPGSPYLMEVAAGPSPNDIKNYRLGFNVNGGVNSSENGSRGGNAGQFLLPVRTSSTEEQMKSFRQIASSATPMKRREPEGGWDSCQLGYRQDSFGFHNLP
ncbi:uncharacterized protein LOC132274646 [Cornus florida]|uniref:uncharacterized protein LOC132274646 n=1 Tax=Cornus florida TaxID=4283 RepID=UPI0028A1853D|nr:uncharacterized protein LOC132274646 [Cornus florida]